jgi:uncharacterized membrane protein
LLAVEQAKVAVERAKKLVESLESLRSNNLVSKQQIFDAGKALEAAQLQQQSALAAGRGRIVVIADPDLLRNDVLRHCDWGVDVLTVRMLEWLRASDGPPRTTLAFDEYHQGYGSRPSVFSVTGAFLTFFVLLSNKIPLRIKNKRTSAQLYGMGYLDTAAFVLSNLGMRIEQVAVVSVLGSLYGAVTVALAATFLKERIAPLQWTGIASIFLGVTLMNL